MTKYFLIFILLVASLQVAGQRFSMNEWHNGRVVVTEGDTIPGKLKYDFANNLVQLQAKGTNEVFALSAQKIVYLDFIDHLTKAFRQFYSLPYSLKRNNYDVPVLFEVSVQGPLTLLTRESIENRTYSYTPYRSYTSTVLVYSFFFLEENGEISHFDGRKKNLSNHIQPHEKEVFRYIKKNRLKTDEIFDLADIVIFYNNLTDKS